MSLRRKLALVCLLLLALPVVAWQSTRQIEQFLREARQDVLLATAGAVQRALPVTRVESGPGLYVHALSRPLQVDGYADDWTQWQKWAQRFVSDQGRFDMTLQLAGYDRWMYALIEVRDATAHRASLDPGGFSDGDHLVLQLRDGRGLNQYRIVASAAGSIELAPVSAAVVGMLPPVQGAWRESAELGGYRVELRFPASLTGDQLTLQVYDSGDGLSGEQRIGPQIDRDNANLIRRDSQLEQLLRDHLPAGNRGWLIDPSGWVIAAGGALDSAAARQTQPASGWQRLLYRLLVGDSLLVEPGRDPLTDLKLDGPEIVRARAGQPSVSWRRVGDNQVVAAAASPHGQQVFVLESRADALLLATNRTARQVIGKTVLLVALVVIALLAYATILSLRVRRLRNAAEQLTSGDHDQSKGLPGTDASDEIGDLARSFSTLLDELNAYNQYLKSLAGKLSHELNTPLAVIRSSLDNLAEHPLEPAAQTYALRARDGADRLAAILRAMSEARRLEQSVAGADVEEFDLAALVRGCVDGYRELEGSQHWQVQTPASATLRGSPDLIAQLLDKLADNARSFCPAEGTIALTLERHRDGWRLLLENDGPLLPEALGGRIFESLVSLREAGANELHLGLGLHIVRIIAQNHGGWVKAANRAGTPGQPEGVRFFVWLRDMPAS